MAVDNPRGLCLYTIAQHTGLGVVVELQTLYILSRWIQVDIVGEVVHVGVNLHAHPVIVPMDTHVNLVTLLWIKIGVAAFVTEDVVIHTVGSQFLGDGHTETLAHIGLQHPVAYGIVDACRPGDTREVAVHVGRTLLIDGVTNGCRCEEPVVITADVGMGMVQSDTGVQFQPFVHGVAVHGISTDGRRLEVWDDKSPATAAVVLIFTIQACAQFVFLA